MEALTNFQMELYQRICKAQTNFKKCPKDRITKQYLESRLELIEQTWFEFLSGHKELRRNSDQKLLLASDYINNEIYDKAEDCYLNYKCELKTALEKFNIVNLPCASNSDQLQFNVKSSPFIKLPKINVPNFSGEYSEWTAFRDLYTALIHSNQDLSKVQKLHYLKSYLTGEAEQYLRHIPIANENYDRCWKLLEERYNNKKYICHLTLKRLFSQKNIVNESASGLKNLIDTTNDCLSSLRNIGVDVGSWDVIIIHILTLKLDPETKRQWEFNNSNNSAADELPTYDSFKEFLSNRYRAMEFLDSGSNSTRKNASNSTISPVVNKMKALYVSNAKCLYCSEAHSLSFCKGFAKETVDARRSFVENINACFNCLGSNHSAKFCRTNARCRICKRKHHSLLHPSGEAITETIEVTEQSMPEEAAASSEEPAVGFEVAEKSISCFSSGRVYNQALLATAIVRVKSKTGNCTVRALLDQGSQSSFVTESTVQRLGLRKIPMLGQISGLGEHESTSKAMVILELQSRTDSSFSIKVEAYVLKSITAPLPTCKINPEKWIHLEDLVLADPEYHTPNRIDVLLGVGVYNQILLEGIRRGPEGAPLAQATSLGWILSGQINVTLNPVKKINVFHCRLDDNELLKRFWELEAEPEIKREKMFTEEEKQCEEIFTKTTMRDDEGRYVVRLPVKNDPPRVDNSREISEKRFHALEHKLNKNKNLKEKYSEVMKEYIDLNHMELVPKEELDNPRAIYLPHHAVIREDKDTTKLRVVFDASCKGKNNMSLNDNLLVGPTLQPELRHLIMRWRIPPICLTADIAKMYRQVKISNLDVDFQRIIWRDNTETEMKHYRMLRVTFGTASAPYLAVKALQQLALDEGDSYPLAAERVLTGYYMDDLLTGCQNTEEGLRIFREMNELLSKGGFELMKWTSNCEKLVEDMKRERGIDNIQEGLKIKSDETLKIVGLTWNRGEDSFRYAVKLPKLEPPVTKRKIISDISRFYDPLGWVGPSIIKSKIIIQKLWLAGIEWDEAVPKNILDEWLTYREDLKLLELINIPRWVRTKVGDKVELHGFSDASKAAYAAVVYIRVIDASGHIYVALLTSKTKVAPVKQVSIPRLELCGAVLLTRLMLETARVLGIEKGNIRAWTDSTVVLAWINSHPSRWKVFVANRVSEIQSNLDSHHWSHIGSKENPADTASRGASPAELISNNMWFSGPDFLRNKHINYEKPKEITTDLEKVKSHCAVLEEGIWERFSSLTRLKRVVAYCKRFINNLRLEPSKRNKNYLTSQELTEALNICIQQYQKFYFKKEILLVKQNKNLPKNSPLRSLNPMLDVDQILRVGGRLEHSGLSYNQKHPILIPTKCHLAELIIADAHERTLHGGPQLMTCFIQAKYWILRAKQQVQKYFRKCVTCAKNSAKTQTQLMGQLPVARVTPMRPFKCSGVDYAGPIQIRTAKGRGHKSHKGYICLFVCMATTAIHLEVVTDLSSQGFLQAFKRFVSRRGHCSDIWSDNATNFTGAASELKKLFLSENGSMLQEVAENVASNDCNWHFIPARSPNFGGLWEAGVKSVKYHLKRIIGQSTLTFEEMSTVLAQVEACLNSRPLSVIANDSEDVTVLTPGHFLIGEPIVTPPDQNYESHNVGSLRRWQYTQKMLQDFWKIWSQEYLTKFLSRYRWSSQQPQPQVGDVVLVKEDGLPPCRWLYGRVIAIHPGRDNLVRVITLKTKTGTFKRPISKVCMLPLATE